MSTVCLGANLALLIFKKRREKPRKFQLRMCFFKKGHFITSGHLAGAFFLTHQLEKKEGELRCGKLRSVGARSTWLTPR